MRCAALFIALLGLIGMAEAQTVTPVSRLKLVVGATGEVIGEVLGLERDTAWVALEIDGHLVVLQANRKGFLSYGDGPFFLGENCDGTALFTVDRSSLTTTPIVTGPQQTIWLRRSPVFRRTLGARRDENGNCIDIANFDADVAAFIPLADLTPLYPPPYYIRAIAP